MLQKGSACIIIILAFAFSQNVYVNKGDARLSPRLLNYQGYITDTLGNPITNPAISMTFGIWSSSGGGSQLWYESQPVSISKGIFSVLLGNITPIPDSVFTKGANRWMELTVAGVTLVPRTRIAAAGYALSATYSDTAFSVVDNAITTPKIQDTSVTMAKIAPAGAAGGQVIKWTGTAWSPGADVVGADADWNYLVSDGADTTLQMGGRWGLSRIGNILYGAADSTHVNFGVACTTGLSGQDYKYCAVGGGYLNKASGYYSAISGGTQNVAGNATGNSCPTVGGGYQNSAGGDYYATIGGGYSNDASGFTAPTVSGGYDNTASNSYSTVGGGQNNVASYSHATVAGGWNNNAGGIRSTVGGGYGNTAINNSTTIGGGYSNQADSNYSTVGGGYDNTASGYSTVISGGCYNTISDNYGTLCGGVRDTVKAPYGSVLGGYSNIAGDASDDTAATVVGGFNNTTSDKYAYIGGGGNNTAVGRYATIAGGYGNQTDSTYATIGGGRANTASGDYACVSGGWQNEASNDISTVGGGSSNVASGWCATVAGGTSNTASGGSAVVGGGNNNTADGGTIAGGVGNKSTDGYGAICGGHLNVCSGQNAAVAGGMYDSSAADYSFTVGNNSTVPVGYNNSAAFNGQSATASGQTRVGALSKVSGTFTIDHPLDPENKILNHYFVESPEMVLIYRGSAVIGEDGRSVVHLPDYFDVLNENPMVQLTGIGSADPVYVAEKVTGNSFVIGGKPGTEVYWTVTGARKDPSAEITKIIMPVEQVKEGGLIGRSLDDEFLVVTMEQLERMGKADGFKFRHASEQKRYEEMKKMIEEGGGK